MQGHFTVCAVLALFLLLLISGPEDVGGDAFRIGNFEEIAPGVGIQFLLGQENVPNFGSVTVVRTKFQGKSNLRRAATVTVDMTDEKYSSSGQPPSYVEVRIELLAGTTWVKPTQASLYGEGARLLPKGARHVHIKVMPNSINDSFGFWFKTAVRPSRVRLFVDGGLGFDLAIPW